MIPVRKEEELYTSNKKEGVRFGMVVDFKAFNILSDSLYTNKVRAVVREYATNAYDSHVDAGKEETPFRIHVPTKLEPYFEVEDFGIGLDEEGVEKVFCTFFHSTKEDDNTVNGCLGLGSKSLYSLSGQATMVTRKDNKEYHYSLYKNPKGEPVAKLISKTTTLKGNGVCLKIPVNPSDIAKWQWEISQIVTGFEVEPLMNNKDLIEAHHDHILYKTLLPAARESKHGVAISDSHNTGVVEVLMGNVRYPVHNALQYLKSGKLRKMCEQVKGVFHVVVRADLGEMMVAPSREALSMCEVTRKNLSRKLTKIVLQKYKELFKSSNTNWGSFYSIVNNFRLTPIWDIISEMPHKKYSIKRLCSEDRYWKINVSILKLEGIDFQVKGLIPKVGYPSEFSYSTKVENINQHRVRSLGRVEVYYGEDKLNKNTLLNIQSQQENPCTVLFCEDQDNAKTLAKHFDCEAKDVTPYLAKPAKRKKVERKSFGKLEDTNCLARGVNIVDGEFKQKPVDLKDEGVFYCSSDYLDFKHRKHSTYWKSSEVKKLMELVGAETIILKNRLNQGKIERNKVKSFEGSVYDVIKSHKTNIIKSVARNSIILPYYESFGDILHPLCKSYVKIRELQETLGDPLGITVNLESLEWYTTKLYKQETKRMSLLKEKFLKEKESLKNRLPLLKLIDKKEDLEYYLKLEKVIK